MNINNNQIKHSFNIQENGLMPLRMETPINTEWEKCMHSGHDALYILRKRALLLDLWNMELPSAVSFVSEPMNAEEEISHKYREYAQKEFLKEICEEQDSWYADESLFSKKDASWSWDCPSTIQ